MMNGTKSYQELIDQFTPRLIRSDEEYWETQAVMDRLIDKMELTDDELDYLSLLGMIIERYDRENNVFPESRGVELVKVLLEDSGLRQKDLAGIFKSESIVSEVLNGNRHMTVEHIDGLAKFFQLPRDLFFESDMHAATPAPHNGFEQAAIADALPV